MYCTSAYFAAKTLCDVVPMRVFPPLIMGSITYYMIQLNPGINHFLTFLAVMVLTSLVATSLSLAISAVTPSLSMGNLIAIILLLFFMLFGGFLVNKSSMPIFIGWLKWTSFLCYSFEILMVNELLGTTIMFAPKGYNITAVPVDGSVFLVQFDMQEDRENWDFFILGAMATMYLFATYLFLRFFNKERR